MILKSKETTVAYRCPKCGQMIFSVVGIFSLSGDLVRLKCPCGNSELMISYTRDRKIKIDVPCLICGQIHSFTISSDTFFGHEAFCYSCPYSGVTLCIIGTSEAAKEAAKEADAQLEQLLREAGVENPESFTDAREADDKLHDNKLPDPEMESVVHLMLCELEDEGAVKCRCQNGGHYEFKFVGDRLDTALIYCTECSASVSVPLTDPAAVTSFLHIDGLKLQ